MSNTSNTSNTFNPKDHVINLERNPNKPKRLYLEVKWRIMGLLHHHPLPLNSQVSIDTQALFITEQSAVIKAIAELKNPETNFSIVRTAMARCAIEQFPDFVEKAETAAIGRVLALIGEGTLQALEYNEGIQVGNETTPEASEQREATRPKLADAPVAEATEAGEIAIPQSQGTDILDKIGWRNKCWKKAEEIGLKNDTLISQEVYDKAFINHMAVNVEDATVEKLKDWYNYLCTDKGTDFLITLADQFWTDEAQKLSLSMPETGEPPPPPPTIIPNILVCDELHKQIRKEYARLGYNSKHIKNSTLKHLGIATFSISDILNVDKLEKYLDYLKNQRADILEN